MTLLCSQSSCNCPFLIKASKSANGPWVRASTAFSCSKKNLSLDSLDSWQWTVTICRPCNLHLLGKDRLATCHMTLICSSLLWEPTFSADTPRKDLSQILHTSSWLISYLNILHDWTGLIPKAPGKPVPQNTAQKWKHLHSEALFRSGALSISHQNTTLRTTNDFPTTFGQIFGLGSIKNWTTSRNEMQAGCKTNCTLIYFVVLHVSYWWWIISGCKAGWCHCYPLLMAQRFAIYFSMTSDFFLAMDHRNGGCPNKNSNKESCFVTTAIGILSSRFQLAGTNKQLDITQHVVTWCLIPW